MPFRLHLSTYIPIPAGLSMVLACGGNRVPNLFDDPNGEGGSGGASYGSDPWNGQQTPGAPRIPLDTGGQGPGGSSIAADAGDDPGDPLPDPSEPGNSSSSDDPSLPPDPDPPDVTPPDARPPDGSAGAGGAPPDGGSGGSGGSGGNSARPSDAAAPDASTEPSCDELYQRVVETLEDAQACNPLLPIVQCQDLVEGLCCDVPVRRKNSDESKVYRRALAELKARGDCLWVCIPCSDPTSGTCGVQSGTCEPIGGGLGLPVQ
jgi:hypothetical protein